MDKYTFIARLSFSFALLALAAALTYFSYSISLLVREVPQIISGTDTASTNIARILDESHEIRKMIPGVMLEVRAVHEKVPAVLAEVEKIRELVVPLIAETSAIQQQIPSIIEEVAAVRKSMPPVLAELAAYRESLVPELLAESSAIRVAIPPHLDRIEHIVYQANNAGQKASEGAVTGFFTGIIKAPFTLVKGFGGSLVEGRHSSSDDKKVITAKTLDLLNTGVVGDEVSFSGPTLNGSISLENDLEIDGKRCRIISLSITDKDDISKTACINSNREWELAF